MGKSVSVLNASEKVPEVDVPGTMSAGTEAVAVPEPLADPPAVMAGTAPAPTVSIIASLLLPVHTL